MAQSLCRITNDKDFGMGRGVSRSFALVVTRGHHVFVKKGNGPDGYFALLSRHFGLRQGKAHGVVVGDGRGRYHLAEAVGFEPTVAFTTHDFQSCRFGRSRTPPGRLAFIHAFTPNMTARSHAIFRKNQRENRLSG